MASYQLLVSMQCNGPKCHKVELRLVSSAVDLAGEDASVTITAK